MKKTNPFGGPWMIAAVLILATSLTTPITSQELGEVVEERATDIPSYYTGVLAGFVPALTAGAGLSASVSLSPIIGLPVVVDARLYPLAMGPLFGIFEPAEDAEDGDNFLYALLGFGGRQYGFGVGYELQRGREIDEFSWIIDETSETEFSTNISGDTVQTTTTTTTFYPITGPAHRSTSVMLDMRIEPVGGEVIEPSDTATEYIVQSGNQLFIGLSYRREIAFDFDYRSNNTVEGAQKGEVRRFHGWSYNKFGLFTNFAFNVFGFAFDARLMPAVFKQMEVSGGLFWRTQGGGLLDGSLYLPLLFTIGIGTNPIPITDGDRAWEHSLWRQYRG